jgi:hypothetical protein
LQGTSTSPVVLCAHRPASIARIRSSSYPERNKTPYMPQDHELTSRTHFGLSDLRDRAVVEKGQGLVSVNLAERAPLVEEGRLARVLISLIQKGVPIRFASVHVSLPSSQYSVLIFRRLACRRLCIAQIIYRKGTAGREGPDALIYKAPMYRLENSSSRDSSSSNCTVTSVRCQGQP